MRILKHLLREVSKRSASGNGGVKMHISTLISMKNEQPGRAWHRVQIILIVIKLCEPQTLIRRYTSTTGSLAASVTELPL